MRTGTSDFQILLQEGQFAGFNLGWDFCAEHEWGVKGLVRVLQIDKDRLGVDGCMIRAVPDDTLHYLEQGEEAALLFYHAPWVKGFTWKDHVERELPKYYVEQNGGVGAWYDKDFGVRVRGKENIAYLKEFRDAFYKLDIALFFGGSGNPFANSGMILALASRLPADVKQALYDSSVANKEAEKITEQIQHDVELAWEKVGGHPEYGHQSNRPWFYLGIRGTQLQSYKQSKRYWLNPTNQQIFDSGWFTREELLAWPQGRGPVWKKNKEKEQGLGQ